VIKRHRTPAIDSVADGAVVHKAALDMVGIGGAVEIALVAGIACGRECGKAAAVAQPTVRDRMPALQWKTGGMLESYAGPAHGQDRVALLAVSAKAHVDM